MYEKSTWMNRLAAVVLAVGVLGSLILGWNMGRSLASGYEDMNGGVFLGVFLVGSFVTLIQAASLYFMSTTMAHLEYLSDSVQQMAADQNKMRDMMTLQYRDALEEKGIWECSACGKRYKMDVERCPCGKMKDKCRNAQPITYQE